MKSWPELPWREWVRTVETIHMWSQIVGKVRLALAPAQNHWWHTTLYLSATGFTTSSIPYEERDFEITFDFLAHELRVADSTGGTFLMPLEQMSVARFYSKFMGGLRSIGIDVAIWPVPVEVVEAIPFPEDEQHATYDPAHARSLWRGFEQADRVLKSLQTGFVGKQSPSHIFWGSFDIAVSRYSGRRAPLHGGGIPNCADWVMQEAYSREEFAMGWWPRNDEPAPSFYAYMYPEPAQMATRLFHPTRGYRDDAMAEFLLPYDDVRQSADPGSTVREFFQTLYAQGADLAGWDRALLEPEAAPRTPPRRAWST